MLPPPQPMPRTILVGLRAAAAGVAVHCRARCTQKAVDVPAAARLCTKSFMGSSVEVESLSWSDPAVTWLSTRAWLTPEPLVRRRLNPLADVSATVVAPRPMSFGLKGMFGSIVSRMRAMRVICPVEDENSGVDVHLPAMQ